MTPVCSPGGGLHFSSPSGIHHQQSAKTGRNLGGSLTSRSSWNEEACAHTGQEQVAACGLDSEAQEKAAHLSPGGTLVGWGGSKPLPWLRGTPGGEALGRLPALGPGGWCAQVGIQKEEQDWFSPLSRPQRTSFPSWKSNVKIPVGLNLFS